MINKLRNKFIALSLSSVLVVLCVILGSINYLNYANVRDSADELLNLLVQNGGSFNGPNSGMHGGPGSQGGFGPQFRDDDDDDDDDWGDFFEDRKPFKGNRRDVINSPETPFDTRYFSVTIDADGSVIDSNTEMVAAVDELTASKYALSLYNAGKTSGFISDYRYTCVKMTAIGNGTDSSTPSSTMYIFLDCARSLGNYQNFLYASIKVGALAFAAVAVLIVLVSRRIVRPVAESYDKQKRFITDAGHEIKTPLTIIDADTAVIEMESGQSEWLDDIRAQTKRLADLTNDLVYLSRMEESQRSQQKLNSFSFTDLARETAKSFESRALLDGKEYTVEIADGIDMTGDDEAVKKLLTILLDNAFKYSNEGGKVSISANKTGGKQFRLIVYNTADHVSREDVPHLFERFYRSEKSRNKETGGYGIGLSIAQAVVTAHTGRITAATDDEKSLTITATLPM